MNDSINSVVGLKIRKSREEKRYTQNSLAAKLKISQNAYSKMELGYTQIVVSRLFIIAQLLEVELIELIATS